MKPNFMFLFLFPLFLSTSLLAGENNNLTVLKKRLATHPRSPIALEYRFSPGLHRHNRIEIRARDSAGRIDSFWRGPRGDRHDLVVIHPKDGIYQGEYYRNSYSLLFWEAFSKGKNSLVSSPDDSEIFAGAFLLWSFIPQTMVKLIADKDWTITDDTWKAKWGGDLQLEIHWKKGTFTLKSFSLSDATTGAKSLYTVTKYQKVGPYGEVAFSADLVLVDSEGEVKKTTMALQKILSSHFEPTDLQPDKEPFQTVVDLQLLPTAQYEKALKKDPKNSRLWFSLARSYVYKGQKRQGERCYEKALWYKPRSGMIYTTLLELFLGRQDYRKAWRYLFTAQTSRVPQVYKLYFLAGQYSRNKTQQKRFLAMGLRRYPYNPSALDLYSRLESPVKAGTYAIKAIEAYPRNKAFQAVLERILSKIQWQSTYQGLIQFYRQRVERLQKKYPKEKIFARILARIPSH